MPEPPRPHHYWHGLKRRVAIASSSTIGRIPWPRTVGIALALFGIYNLWTVNRGSWYLLYLLPAHYAYPQAPGPVIGLYFALMSFIGAVKGIISVGLDSNAVRFVGLGAVPLIAGSVLLLVNHSVDGVVSDE